MSRTPHPTPDICIGISESRAALSDDIHLPPMDERCGITSNARDQPPTPFWKPNISKEMFRKFADTFSRFTNFLVNFGIDPISIWLPFAKAPAEQPHRPWLDARRR